MDVKSVLESGGYVHENPEYNPKTKKGQYQPKYIVNADPNGALNQGSALADVLGQPNRQMYNLNYLGDPEKYGRYGITINPISPNLDDELADAQSNWSKGVNALGQTLVSEIILGTAKGASDFFDAIGQAIGISDHNYSNPVSQYLEEKQKEFEEFAPVYVNSKGNSLYSQFTGDFNLGWWFSNIPSIASSLTLLIPSTGITKGISWLGKATKISKYTNKAARSIINPIARSVRGSGFTANEIGVFAETGLNAALSRTMENYQESRQTYNDTYIDIASSLKDMSPEEYNNFLERNSTYLENAKVDTSNKDEVAKQIAKSAADRTFQLDIANVIFDAYQIYGLRNLLTHAPKFNQSAATRRAQREVIRTAGLSTEEATAELAKDTSLKKVSNWFKDNFIGATRQIKSELSEGIEEAVNYVAQQEGTHLGKYILTGEDGNIDDLSFFSSLGPMHRRLLNDYINDTGLWDSAFWGVVGGVVFQAGGNKLNRLSQTIKNRSEEKKSANKDNEETKEAKVTPHWWQLDQLNETERMLSEINSRPKKLNDFREAIQRINSGYNPYIKNDDGKDQEISSPVEERMLREKAYTEYLDDMIVSARNNGTLDMLKSYLENENVRNAIVNAYRSGDANGHISIEEAKQAAERAASRIQKIDNLYKNEVIHAADIAERVGNREGTNLPAEYIQMIASANVRHKLNLERYDEVAALYNEDTERIKQVVGDKFDMSIDYQGLISLRTTIQELSSLVAEKKELEEKQKENPNITRQFDIDEINNQINVIKRKALQTATDQQFARTLYALQVANSAVREYSPDGKNFKVNASDSELIANLDNFITKDLKYIFDEVNQESREISTDAVIGELRKISNDLKYILPSDKRSADDTAYLSNIDPKLPDNYDILARIELEKIKETAKIAETETEIRHYIGAINNIENVARKKAIEEAFDDISEIQRAHTDLNILDIANRIYNNQTAQWLIDTNVLTEDERTKLRNALKVLNLADVRNKSLFTTLAETLLYTKATQKQVDANNKQNTERTTAETQNSSTSQNANSDTTNRQTNNQSGTNKTQNNEQGKDQIEQNENQNTPTEIELSYNGNTITATIPTAENRVAENIIPVKDLGNGNFELDFLSKGTTVNPRDISNNQLFDVKQQPMDGAVVKRNPIVKFGNNNEIQVVGQGLVEDANISSTGEVTASQSQPQDSSNDETTTNDNNVTVEAPVIGADPAEYIPQIAMAARQAAIRLKEGETVTYTDYLAGLINIKTAINDDATFERHAKEAWNTAMQRLARNYPSIVDSVISTLQSSTTEEAPESKLGYRFRTAFKKEVENLVKAYLKDIGQKKVNGKYVISLENLLRYCNGEFQNNENAELLYNVLANYLMSDEASSTYQVIETKQEVAAPNFLNNVKTPLQERIEKSINEENHRINTRGIKNKEIFDRLEPGQELTTVRDKDRIYFEFEGNRVGYIGIPKVVNGTYSSPYGYFLFRIRPNGKDTYYSKLADVFKSIANATEGDLKEIRDAALIGGISLKDNKTWSAIKDEFTINTIDRESGEEWDDVDDNLLQTIRTMASYSIKFGNANAAIDSWFNNLAQEYIAAATIDRNRDAKVIIDAITDGFLIRAQENVEDVKSLPLASKAIGKNYKGRVSIAIGSRKEAGTIETVVKKENDKVIIPASNSLPGVGYSNTFVVFPLSQGKTAYAQAYPITARELNKDSQAAKIVTAFSNKFNKYLEDIANNPTNNQLFKELQDFLFEALNYKNATTPLFHMDNCEKVNVGDDRGTHIGTNNKRGSRRDLRIFCNPGKVHKIQIDNETITITKANISTISNKVKQFLADTLQFNISTNYIASDNNTRNQVEGFATRDKDGKFVVKIGDESWTFDSYNDFILENDLVRVNTKPNEHGNNVTRTSSNPNVRYRIVTSSPVEKSVAEPSATTNIEEAANQIMSSDRTDKAAQLARLIFDSDTVTTLSTYGLLPTNLVYDSNFNTGDGREKINASFNTTTKVTTIGPRFIAMLSNQNEAYRKQAVRKLIHERLHDILHSNNNEHYIQDIKSIFEQFVQYNKDNNAEEKYTKYEYKNKASEEERLEEFLVDSLTSQELANYLNSITTLSKVNMRERKRDTLLNKIMRLLAKIMGVRIKNDSLYAQEFEALRQAIDSKQEETVQFEENDVTSKEQQEEKTIVETESSAEQSIQENKNVYDYEEDDDEYSSSTTEEYENVASIADYIQSYSPEDRAEVAREVNNGEISIKCK